jgi:hypothetical protein
VEVSRIYKEVIDILTEAFDEYDPEELPKYQDRLDNVVKLVKEQGAFSDPLFLDDLDKATEILNAKVKRRWSTFDKIKTLASTAIRVVGSSSAIVQEILDIGSQAESLGRRAGSIFRGRVRVDDEESRRVRDLIKGNTGQYGNYESPQGSASNRQNTLTPLSNSAIAVKDDKLIGTNTTQNKVLNNLLDVSKETNVNIKTIKNLLINQERQRDDKSDDATLDALENNREKNALVAIKNDRKLLQSILGPESTGGLIPSESDRGDNQGGSTISDMLVQGYAIKKGVEWIAKGGKKTLGAIKGIAKKALPALKKSSSVIGRALPWLGRGAATVAASPAVGTAATIGATALTAYEVGGLINDYVVDPAVKKLSPKVTNIGQSISATVGEKTKGIEYYKQLFKSVDFDGDSQEKAEKWALEFLAKIAKEKEELFQKAYENGSQYGDGSYKINNKDASISEALLDVKAAKEQYEYYKRYLLEKEKKGGLTATARFRGSDNKIYSNPLYRNEEQPPIVSGQSQIELKSDALKTQIASPAPIPAPAPTPDLTSKERKEASVRSVTPLSPTSAPNPTPTEAVMRGITAAETGIISDERPIDDPSRFIRTKGGAESSAYGPQQITMSLAKGALEKGLLDGDEELKTWVQDKFIPQGRKFLQSDYSHPTYGAGGQGDLNTPEDRKMYQKMSERLIGEAVLNNKGNLESTLGEWRFGRSKRHMLDQLDPGYAIKAKSQISKDQVLMAKSDVEIGPKSQNYLENAVSSLSRENEAARTQPIIISQNSGGSGKQEEPMPSASMKSVGAPANGASESTLMIAIRQSISPI